MEQDQDFHDESDSQPLRVRVDLSSILGSLPPRLIPLQKTIRYVRRNKTDLKKHREKEKELKRMVLQAAEGGHLDVIRQALPVLHTVQQRLELPLARLSHPPHPELNFDDRRGLWKEQVCTYDGYLFRASLPACVLLLYLHLYNIYTSSTLH